MGGIHGVERGGALRGDHRRFEDDVT